jgi:hypothetical protein
MVSVAAALAGLLLVSAASAGTGRAATQSHAAPPAAGLNFTFKTFDVPNAGYTDVLGINNLGVTVGQYGVNTAPDTWDWHGFIAWGGHLTTVDVPGALGTGIEAINDLGTAVGWWWGSDGSVHGFIRSWSGAITTIDGPNAYVTQAFGINDLGVVVGFYQGFVNGEWGAAHGFQYQHGKLSTLDVPGWDDTIVQGINNLGAITGWGGRESDASWPGFAGSIGGGYSVFTGAGDTGEGTYPQAINDWGTVVGHSNNTMFVGWQRLHNGQMTTITDPLAATTPPPCGCYGGTAPGGINDLGTVTGIYFDNNGDGHGFIATPTR